MQSEGEGAGERVGGHVPYWPPYLYSDKARDHKLCFLSPLGFGSFGLTWEGGSRSQPFRTYEEWKALLLCHQKNVDCFVEDLGVDGSGFPWIDEAIHDSQANVKCSKNGGVTSITVRVGNKYLSIGSLASWKQELMSVDPLDFFSSLRSLGSKMGTGTRLTPGALGTASLQREWTKVGKNYPKVSRPNLSLLKALTKNKIGGRVESFTDKKVMQSVELDLRSAYASCCDQVPWGTAWTIPNGRSPAETSAKYATWFCKCTVTIVDELVISPIPIRRRKKWVWVTEPGVYVVWLWREEVEAAIRAKITVEVEEGWGWKSLSNRLKPWVDEMERYRVFFEDSGRLDIARMVKRCTVAAIGYLGCSIDKFTLEYGDRKGNIPLIQNKPDRRPHVSDYSMHVTKDMRAPSPNHLHAYILMRCRLKVYEREVDEAHDGNEVLSVNFDAIYVTSPSKRPTGRGMGEWKQEEREARTEAGLFPYPRALNSKVKLSLPGMRRDSPVRLRMQGVSSAGRKQRTNAPEDATD